MGSGQNFERKIAKRISLWFTGRDDAVWRTAGSGARATMRAKKKKCTANSEGDLCYLDDSAKSLFELFVFELKKGYSKDIDVLSLIDGFSKKNFLYQWWLKISKAAAKIDREPLLIINRNGKQPIIVYNYDNPWGRNGLIPMVPNGNSLLWRSADKKLYLAFTLLEDFLKRYPQKDIKAICDAEVVANQKISSAQAIIDGISSGSECHSPRRNKQSKQYRKNVDRSCVFDAVKKQSTRGKVVSQNHGYIELSKLVSQSENFDKSKIRRLRSRRIIKKNKKK